jgi:2-polyprenyl-6-methoxyphenol hydroxylase-like FAD-dependent oxidoreductase
LRETFPEERYHAGCELLEFTDAGGTVSARFADGSEVCGNLLIGADGSRSTIRQ